jgi:N-acetylglutamate synthase-like GNAT family acetyltransferase
MMKIEDTTRAKTLFKESPHFFNQMKLIVGQTFIIEDKGLIIGIASYKKKEKGTAIIDCLYVSSKERGLKLGDGLLRGLLNHMQHQNIKRVFVTSPPISQGFFIAEGLEIVPRHLEPSDNLTFVIDLPAFFERGCKSSRHQA